jgi:uncharacterized protein (TIGR04255 family)
LTDEARSTIPIGPPLPEPPPLPERREYPNPPIVEGLVQFSFREPITWNVAIPGRVFERLQYTYPTDPEVQGMLQAAFNPQAASDTPADFTVTQGGQRIIYRDDSKTRLIVLNDRSLSVNSLRPYEGWIRLSDRITVAIAALAEVIAFPLISEVAVRYINQIPLPMGKATEDYFIYDIHTARSGASYLRNFLHRVESILPDGVTIAGTTFASGAPQTEDAFPVLLDIEYKRTLQEGLAIGAALEVAYELKKLENAEFESVITDAARELFE